METFRLLRPAQWVKNFFVFLPLFFGGEVFDVGRWIDAAAAFIAFCLVSSAVYCINDVRDAEADRRHPVKRFRPIASGKVGKPTAIGLSIGLLAGSLAFCFVVDGSESATLAAVIAIYFVLNIGYCFGLKNLTIVDVFIIALGFVLRVAAGGVSTSIELSPWIICLTFLLALFLAFAKRRDDVVIAGETGVNPRRSSSRYNIEYLNLILGLLGAIIIVGYIIYTVQPDVIERLGSRYVYVTALFVVAGILRYLQLAVVDGSTGSPTKLAFHDRFLQLCVAGWVITFFIILYV